MLHNLTYFSKLLSFSEGVQYFLCDPGCKMYLCLYSLTFLVPEVALSGKSLKINLYIQCLVENFA